MCENERGFTVLSLKIYIFFSLVAPDLVLGLALLPGGALPHAPAPVLSQLTTRRTGKTSFLDVSFTETGSRLFDTIVSPAHYQCFTKTDVIVLPRCVYHLGRKAAI